ncbi:MAG: hypothetical protein F6K14_29250 [Symploca sp. SIO2C1]|nr:hypothetical protein [Symploca sp. SIO2C1]
MRDYQQLINRFSLIIHIRQSRPVYQSDPKLQNIMEYLVESDPEAGVEDWARYFLKALIDTSKLQLLFIVNATGSVNLYFRIFRFFCQRLLFAYLQPTCLQAAQIINNQFKGYPNIHLHYPLEDCFIIASEFAHKSAQLLKNFNFQSNSKIHAYALNALRRIIKNQIADKIKLQSVKLSDYGLLRSLDKNRLEQILQAEGIWGKSLVLHLLTWQSFKELFEEFQPPTSSDGSHVYRLPTTSLNNQQLKQIAVRYNQQLRRLDIHAIPANDLEIKQKLEACIQAARTCQNTSFVPLGDDEVSVLDSNPLEIVVDEERQNELLQVRNIILQEFAALDFPAQPCLRLWLGLGINQSDFLSIFNLKKQYQLARKFQGYLKPILAGLVRFYLLDTSRSTLTNKEINQLASNNLNALKHYLITDSQEFFGQILEVVINERLSAQEKRLLICQLPELGELTEMTIVTQIKESFKESVFRKLQVQLSDFDSADRAITQFIGKWLHQNQAHLY